MAYSEVLPFEIGSRVSVVFYRDSMPIVVDAAVVSTQPFMISTDNPTAGRLARMRRALVVKQDGEHVWRVEAEIVDAAPEGNQWICTLQATRWSEIDRRRHPRFPTDLQAIIRTVVESDGEMAHAEITGRALDVSESGARIQVSSEFEPGSLAEVKLYLGPDNVIQMLAVIAFTKPYQGQYGFEFVDYFAGAQYTLHSYLTEKAA